MQEHFIHKYSMKREEDGEKRRWGRKIKTTGLKERERVYE